MAQIECALEVQRKTRLRVSSNHGKLSGGLWAGTWRINSTSKEEVGCIPRKQIYMSKIVVAGSQKVYKVGVRVNKLMLGWRRQWHPTPVLLPGKSHGLRSLVGWGHRVTKSLTRLSDFTFIFHFHFSLSFIGEGNGNPLQCSCLENPRDRGAWWAAVCGVTQSRTRLKWLSSSRWWID